jgi:hypothetical protein
MKIFKTRQTYLLFVVILSVFLITGCGGGGETGHWLPGSDTTAPTVSSTVPANAATGVPIGNKLTATFSEAMDPATITTTTFTLKQGATAVPGTVTYAGVTAVFTPASNLAASTTYTATITTGAKDLAGNALASDYVWSFTTGAAPDTTAPTVTAVVPLNNAAGVAINTKMAAAFSETMDPLTITAATFTLTQGVTPVSGAVTYAGVTATFTPTSNLLFSTVYTATITTGAKDLAGNALAVNKVWTFTTGAASDTTAPTMSSTIPVNAATGVAVNSAMAAAFSEAMDPLTITTATFTLKQGATAVSGTVTYSGVTAVFTPASNLAASTTYTATITTGGKDLAGNALASDYVWSFTTGAAADTTNPTVTLTVPANSATGVRINTTIAATFSEAMDPATITTANFTVAGVTGTVTYNTITKIATFTPASNLAAGTLFTATITTGVKDLAGNALAVNKVWTFTTGTATGTTPVALGAAAPFGGFGGGAGMTNQGILTIINGDIGTTGVSTTMTGFHDSVGDVYTETPLNIGRVNGRIYTAAPPPGGAGVGGNAATFVIATAAASDALIAYNSMSPASLPGGVDPGAGQLGGLTLAPGIYKAAGATFLLTGSDLTLDGQGDPNAVWVFQTAAGLTIGAPGFPRSIILINGAQAKNVFWYVGSAARIEDRSSMVGTIIASAGVTISTAGQLSTTTLEGRALGLNASVTMVNTLINVPAP